MELAARLDRLDLPRYERTFAAMADSWKRAVGSTDEWQRVSLSFVRTVATIAAGDGRGLLWGNDVCPDVWREALGLSSAWCPPGSG
ncbi:hypothetical protein ACTMS2_27400 [Micromonospora sp. SD12]|uniref:hypothetical protein n=1 Tax=Micromonospora sp. SD12 TaxID=3452216 RepID=UPI003F89D9D4